jgi:ParB family chromosome partitioning protein
MTMQTIPLHQLRLSPRNARKTGGTDIDALAASIAAHGLLQNLTVTIPGDGGFDGAEVVAGGRRLAALQLLASRGEIVDDYSVPVCIIADASALEASTAENTVREPMHPADQFDAFARMVDEGNPVTDIAAHFGVSEAVVCGRLKLANVAPEIVADYRAGKATLEQMMALAITDDQDAQRGAWIDKDRWEREPKALRNALTDNEVRSSDKRARLIGLAAYEAAGGVVRRDLFDGSAYLLDEPLLDRLVAERLQVESAALADEGWSFVRVIDNDPWKFTSACKRSQPTTTARALTEEQKQQLEQCLARREALQEEIERIEEETDETIEDDHPAAAEFDTTEATIKALTAPIEIYTDRQKAKSGCVIHLDHDGNLDIERGLIPESAKAAKAVAAAQGKPPEKQAPTLSADMQQRLQLHRAAAARVMIARQPLTALRMLLAHLVANLVSHTYAAAPFHVHVSNEQDSDARKYDDVAASTAAVELRDRVAAFTGIGMPKAASEVHAWLESQTTNQHIDLLGVLLALTVESHAGENLAKYFGIDMTEWWEPTADTYLTLVPKSLLAEAVAEVAGQPSGDAINALKRDAAIAKAAEHLADTGWLPKPLRGDGYRPRTKLTAEPDPPRVKTAKAAAVKKGKKPAKKAAAKKGGAKKKPAAKKTVNKLPATA